MKTLKIVSLIIVAGSVLGCGSSQPYPASDSATNTSASQVHLGSYNNQPRPDDRNEEQLAVLWTERYGKQASFSIESGDVLHVSVPQLGELQERTVRVDEQGNISLPLLGTLHAAGLTEDALRQQLTARASEYMYHPQVDLFVASYSSRQAGVLGEVRNPGMYTLHGPEDTVRQMIQRAGGINDNGEREVLLMPLGSDALKPPSANPSATQYGSMPGAAGRLVSTASQNPGSPQGTMTPLVISLVPGGPDERYLDLPVIPGDTLLVPRAGDVTVTGWVYTPKVIPITPGLTVLGAVAAAGGPMFAADKNAVELIRQDGNGQIAVHKVDLDRITKHESPDVEVQANDVVQVSYSTLRIPPYAAYYVLQSFATFGPMALISGGL
jgi:protein involved in polysaccharide export with SLBB domain